MLETQLLKAAWAALRIGVSVLFLALSTAACHQRRPGHGTQAFTNQASVAKNNPFANETDFVCNMKAMPDFTDTCHYQGKVYAFCSTSCKEKFAGNPTKYVSGK